MMEMVTCRYPYAYANFVPIGRDLDSTGGDDDGVLWEMIVSAVVLEFRYVCVSKERVEYILQERCEGAVIVLR